MLTADPADKSILNSEYEAGHAIGPVRVGEEHLFIKVKLKTYCVPYSRITRYFRRVFLIPSKLCCGKGELRVENLVVCGEDGSELIQSVIPGEKAARLLMKELKEKMPDVPDTRPILTDPDPEQG